MQTNVSVPFCSSKRHAPFAGTVQLLFFTTVLFIPAFGLGKSTWYCPDVPLATQQTFPSRFVENSSRTLSPLLNDSVGRTVESFPSRVNSLVVSAVLPATTGCSVSSSSSNTRSRVLRVLLPTLPASATATALTFSGIPTDTETPGCAPAYMLGMLSPQRAKERSYP